MVKSASRMNTVLKYVIGLDLLNCHAKSCGDTISRSRENDLGSCLVLVIFRVFPNWNCHFRRRVRAAGGDVVEMFVLQSYRNCSFCKHKPQTRRCLDRTCSSVHTRKSVFNQFRRYIAIYHLLNNLFLRWLESHLASTLIATLHGPCDIINKH